MLRPLALALLGVLETFPLQPGGASLSFVLSRLLGPFSPLNVFHLEFIFFPTPSKDYCLSQVRDFLFHPVEFQPPSIRPRSYPFFPYVLSQLSSVLIRLSNFVSSANFIRTTHFLCQGH